MVSQLKIGLLLWPQATAWPQLRHAALQIDEAGYEHLWFYDHLYAINTRDPYLSNFEGWATVSGMATITSKVRLGLLVGANTFRNPGLVAKIATTVDHMSGGRAIVGLGGAWNELEHRAFGVDFGSSPGQRLTWLDESAGAIRRLLDGVQVISGAEDHYRFDGPRVEPRPLQEHLPIMIGGSGERRTLRAVARYADMWNLFGDEARLAAKDAVLRRHCEEVGRDPGTIERTVSAKLVIRDTPAEAREVWAAQMENNRCPEEDWDDATELWLGPPTLVADELKRRREVGFHTFIGMLAAPFDDETIERLIAEVKPMADAG